MNRILESFRQGKPSLGTFTHMKSSVAIECLGYTGLDFVVIDMEHSPTDMEVLSSGITAAAAAGITPLVRVPEISRSAILRPLDIGAMGVIVPAVETVEQVRQLVEYSKFTPVGNRGFCRTRDGGWGYAENMLNGSMAYMEECNRQTLLLPQCETAGCLNHIEEIVAIDGVDGIFVGPMDLSISLGTPLQMDTPVMKDALKRILTACQNANKPAFFFCGDAAAAKMRIAEGFQGIALSLDTMVYINTYRTMVNDVLK